MIRRICTAAMILPVCLAAVLAFAAESHPAVPVEHIRALGEDEIAVLLELAAEQSATTGVDG
jgi:hypothetical protein